MTPKQLARRYAEGSLTGHEAVVRWLCLLDPADAGGTLGEPPAGLIGDLRAYPDAHVPGRMRASQGGGVSTDEAVRAARRWLNDRDHPGGPT